MGEERGSVNIAVEAQTCRWSWDTIERNYLEMYNRGILLHIDFHTRRQTSLTGICRNRCVLEVWDKFVGSGGLKSGGREVYIELSWVGLYKLENEILKEAKNPEKSHF